MAQWLEHAALALAVVYVLWLVYEQVLWWLRRQHRRWPAQEDLRLERSPQGVLEMACSAPDLRMVDQLVGHLRRAFGARVTYRFDSPTGDMIRRLQIDGETIQIQWQEWGEDLTISPTDPNGEDLLRRIAGSVGYQPTEPVTKDAAG